MKKNLKFWSVGVLALLIFISLVNTRPRALESIMIITPDFITVEVSDWEGTTLNSKGKELTQDEFHEVVKMMNEYEYKRSWEDHFHYSEEGSFYFITFKSVLKNSHDNQMIILSKDGLMEIDKRYYKVSAGMDKSQKMIEDIHNYISRILERQKGPLNEE